MEFDLTLQVGRSLARPLITIRKGFRVLWVCNSTRSYRERLITESLDLMKRLVDRVHPTLSVG